MRVDVLLGATQAARQLDVRDHARDRGEHRERRAVEDLILVAREQRDQPGQVGRRPLAGLVALADGELARAREAGEEARVVDLEHLRLRGGVAEAAHAVGSAQLERAVLDARERPLEHAAGDRPDHAGPRACGDRGLLLDAAHVGIDPRSGSNGGLRWNGTRLRHSWSACQWMRVMTCAVIHG